MSGEPTEEESKNSNVVKIQMKQYDPDSNKATSFFTDLNAEQILTEITEYLEDSQTEFKISGNASKISYAKAREGKVESAKDDELVINEQAEIAVQLFNADNGMIAVEFKRKQGSSMIFYDQFNMLRDKIAPSDGEEVDDTN